MKVRRECEGEGYALTWLTSRAGEAGGGESGEDNASSAGWLWFWEVSRSIPGLIDPGVSMFHGRLGF